jgi:hypothetical protein
MASVGAAVRVGLERGRTLAAVRAAVVTADPGHRTPDVIARYASDRFIGDAYDRFTRQDAARRFREAQAAFSPLPKASAVAGWQRWDQYRAEGAASTAIRQKGTGHSRAAVPR